MTAMIDFGNTSPSKFIEEMKTANQSVAKGFAQTLMKTGAMITFKATGTLMIKLESMTDGFIPNMSFTLAEASFLATLGGGDTQLTTGIYFHFNTDVVGGLVSVIKGIYEHFSKILTKIGITLPDFTDKKFNTKIGIGIFINKDAVGFDFSFIGLEFKCILIFKGTEGSCNVGTKFFSAIAEGGKWVIKKASKLFDKAGEQIVKLVKGVGQFAKEVVEDIKKAADSAVKCVKDVCQTVATSVKTTVADAKKTIKGDKTPKVTTTTTTQVKTTAT